MLEIRTVAGPPGVVQWVLSGGPYTAWSQSRHVQVVCPPRALERRLMAYEHFAEAEGVPVGMVLVDAGEVDLPTRSRLEIDR